MRKNNKLYKRILLCNIFAVFIAIVLSGCSCGGFLNDYESEESSLSENRGTITPETYGNLSDNKAQQQTTDNQETSASQVKNPNIKTGDNVGEIIGGNAEEYTGDDEGGNSKPVHVHDWIAITHPEPVYETIHHDAITHQEQVPHTEAVGYVSVCHACFMEFEDPYELGAHIDAEHDGLAGSHVETKYETVYTDETVIDQEAYDEVVQSGTIIVTDYYRCSDCGAVK